MISVVVVVVLVTLALASSLASAEKTLPVKAIPVDMALPASQRWDEAVKAFGGPVAGKVIDEYFTSLAKFVPAPVLSVIESVAADLDNSARFIPKDLRDEMRALAKGLGLDLGMVVALNYLYALRSLGPKANTTGPLPPADLFQRSGPSQCTSIVATATDNAASGQIHVRNMDWNLPSSVRMMSFKCEFKHGATPLFQGACFVGFVGATSGFVQQKDGGYGITINERDVGGDLAVDVATALFEDSWGPTHALRQILSTARTFDDALAAARTIKLAAPVYYIISGPGKDQGHVITRNRLSVHSDRAISGESNYFVGQTNYDWDTQPPSYDDRRKYMLEYMKALTPKGVTEKSMMGVINHWPVLNYHTAYTTLMIPKTGTFEMFIRLNSSSVPSEAERVV